MAHSLWKMRHLFVDGRIDKFFIIFMTNRQFYVYCMTTHYWCARMKGEQINGFSHIITSITHGVVDNFSASFRQKPQQKTTNCKHFKKKRTCTEKHVRPDPFKIAMWIFRAAIKPESNAGKKSECTHNWLKLSHCLLIIALGKSKYRLSFLWSFVAKK